MASCAQLSSFSGDAGQCLAAETGSSSIAASNSSAVAEASDALATPSNVAAEAAEADEVPADGDCEVEAPEDEDAGERVLEVVKLEELGGGGGDEPELKRRFFGEDEDAEADDKDGEDSDSDEQLFLYALPDHRDAVAQVRELDSVETVEPASVELELSGAVIQFPVPLQEAA